MQVFSSRRLNYLRSDSRLKKLYFCLFLRGGDPPHPPPPTFPEQPFHDLTLVGLPQAPFFLAFLVFMFCVFSSTSEVDTFFSSYFHYVVKRTVSCHWKTSASSGFFLSSWIGLPFSPFLTSIVGHIRAAPPHRSVLRSPFLFPPPMMTKRLSSPFRIVIFYVTPSPPPSSKLFPNIPVFP